jgi:hypothetical protein
MRVVVRKHPSLSNSSNNHLCEEAHSITHHANLIISTFAFTYTFGFGFFFVFICALSYTFNVNYLLFMDFGFFFSFLFGKKLI